MKLLALLLLLLLPNLGHANQKGNGGDICELRIQNIRDDIKEWLNRGGGKQLTLPAPLTPEGYTRVMLEALEKANLSCVEDRLFIDQVEKTCKNFPSSNDVPTLVCNIDRFLYRTTQSDQYVLTHHEYAGLAGLESNDGTESSYVISSQLTGFLEDRIVKRLVIKENPFKPGFDPFDDHTCSGPDLSQSDFTSKFPQGSDSMTKAYQLFFRSRSCLAFGVCSDWSAPASAPSLSGEAKIQFAEYRGRIESSLKLRSTINETEYFEAAFSMIDQQERTATYDRFYAKSSGNKMRDLGPRLKLKTGALATKGECLRLSGSSKDRFGNEEVEYAGLIEL